MSKSVNHCIALLSLCITAFTGCNTTVTKVASETSANTVAVDRVTAGAPNRKTLQLFTEQPGRVTPFEEAPILSKISGYVESVHFDIGDNVSKGQLLIRIFAPEYKDLLEQKRGLYGQAEAEVKQTEAELVAAEAALNSAKALVTQAQAGVVRTDAEYARWDSEVKRIEQLVSKGAVTEKLAEETTSQFKAAIAARQEAIANIESTKARQNETDAKVLTARADIEAAKAKLKVAQAEIAQAETMLTYTEILAPFDGVITSRNVDAGHYVQPAGSNLQKALLTLANVAKVRVFVNIPESEAVWINAGFANQDAGDPVTISSPVLPGGKLQSRITRTSRQLDSQSRTLTAEIDLDNQQLKFLPGAYVTTKTLLEKRENAIVLPVSAVVKTAEGDKCCVVIDNKITHRPIELGLRVGDEVEVTSGLDGSEMVVLLRANSLQVGQSVEIIKKP
jgi:RND family efflux transporter MFP subunit